MDFNITPEVFSFIALFLITFSFLPQTIQTIRTGQTVSINLSMYIMYPAGCAFMLIYGLLIENYSIVFWEAVAFALSAIITAIKIKNRIKHGEK